MNLESLRTCCLSLPHVTSNIQWGNDLLFRVGEKIFAVTCLELTVPHRISFKCTPEEFSELIERDGIIPAPYMAHNHWVTLERFDALPDREIQNLIRRSYEMMYEKLPKKVKTSFEQRTVQSAGSSTRRAKEASPSGKRRKRN